MTTIKPWQAILGMVVLSFMAADRAGALTNVVQYSDTFEGYTQGTSLTNGFNNWYASDTNCVVSSTNGIGGSGTNIALIPIDVTLSNRFSIAAPTNVYISLAPKLVRYEGTNNPTVDTNASAMFYLNSNGFFVAYNGLVSDWVTLTAYSNALGAWTNLDLYLNFSNKTWQFNVGGNVVSNNLGFANPNLSTFNGFDVYNGGDSTTYVDNVYIYDHQLHRYTVDPTALANEAFIGKTAATQTFDIASSGIGRMPYTITTNGGANWLRISSGQGALTNTATETISVSYISTGLAQNVYSETLNVITTNEVLDGLTATLTQSVSIVLTMSSMFTTPTNITRAVMHGNAPTSQVLTITIEDITDPTFTVTTNVSVNWMAVRPGVGSLLAGNNRITNNFSTNGLEVGVHTARLTVVSTLLGGTTNRVGVIVTNVSHPIPSIINSYAQVIQRGAQPANTNLSLSNAGAAPRSGMRYTVTSDAAWLTTATNGVITNAESRDITVQFADMSATNAGTYSGTLSIATVDTNAYIGYTPVGQISSNVSVAVSVTIVNPGTPGSLAASDGTDTGGIQLTWTATTNVNHYEVWRSTVNDINQASAIDTNVTTTSYSDTSVDPGLYRYYWVRAVNDYGYAGSFASDSGYRYLPPPTGLTASSGTYSNRVALSWTAASTGAVNYAVKRHTSDSVGAATVLGTVSAATTTYDDTTAAADTTYYYWVGSATPDMTNYSASATGYRVGALTAPGNVSATQGTRPYSVRVSWNAVASATSYEIERTGGSALSEFGQSSTATDLPLEGAPSLVPAQVTVGATTNVFFDDNATVAGVSYTYTVRARNSLGYGEYSGSATGWRQSRSATTSGQVANDYEGDKLAELVVYNANSSILRILSTVAGAYTNLFGSLTDPSYVPVRGDYDNDGLADPAIYSASNGYWQIMVSSFGYFTVSLPFGGVGQKAVPADYDGDQKTDPATYEADTGTFRAMPSSYGYAPVQAPLGGPGYVGVFADYDGDGKADLAVYSATEGLLRAMLSGLGYAEVSANLGGGLVVVPGDFDGDDKSEVTTYNEATGILTVMLTSMGYAAVPVPLGGPGYAWVVPGDYDGDGNLDPAVYSQTSGWIVMFSGSGYATVSDTFGGTNNVPFVP
ncbi:MAG: fibronectin type III domain-containing protein [Lentisphaerae bacterium]|nr:fibronectin type III domain-containing protein [Lentisphaerota bacterium]